MDYDSLPYVDFDSVLYQPQFAAQCLGITPKALQSFENEPGMEVRRHPRGSVQTRVYSPADLFKIASIRRAKGLTRTFSKPITISTFVQKGGTAKTTTSVNLAMYLGFSGFRVLLIDNDPQGDATSMLGYDPDLTPEELEAMGIPADRHVTGSLGNVMAISPIFPAMQLADVVKKPFGEHGPHLLPAEGYLEELEVALNSATNADFRYARFISEGRKGKFPSANLEQYDVIIFDNAPSGSRMTRNSMVASDLILCPIRMDKFSCRALARLAHRLQLFVEEYERAPDVAAIPTMFIKNRPRAAANLATLSEMFPGKVVDGKLYFSEDYSKALESGLPVMAWKGASANSAGAMRGVFDEIVERMAAL